MPLMFFTRSIIVFIINYLQTNSIVHITPFTLVSKKLNLIVIECGSAT